MRVEIFDHMEQCTAEEVQRLLPMVSKQRREQALRYKHVSGQFCCLKSWVMLEELMSEGMKELMNEWEYNEHGKPYIEGAPYFSISHCKEGIAVAIDDEPIGIDIEGIRHADEDLIKRVMNEGERLAISGERLADRDRAFTRLWTQKEAVVKMQGVGIQSFEQLQHILSEYRATGIPEHRHLETIERDNYIYSIAYGKLRSISA